MVITVDRYSNLFKPEICDLINVRAKRLEALIDNMSVPDVKYKEQSYAFSLNFTPVNISLEDDEVYDVNNHKIPGAKRIRTLSIKSFYDYSYRLGNVCIINVVFDEIAAETKYKIPNQEDQTFPYFQNKDWIKIANMDTSLKTDILFRCLPLNSEESKKQYGSAVLGKIKSDDRNLYIKGSLDNKCKLPIYTFFIK